MTDFPTKEQIVIAKEWADQYLHNRIYHLSPILVAVALVVVDYCTPEPEPMFDIDGSQMVLKPTTTEGESKQ